MNKTIKIYIFIFVAIFIAMIANDATKPKKVDWNPSFLSKHKSPYGTFIIHNELENLFPNSKLSKARKSPYEHLLAMYKENIDDVLDNSIYMFINDEISLGEASTNELLAYVEDGNTVFMASHSFPDLLEEALGFKTNFENTVSPDLTLMMANKNLSRTKYNYDKAVDDFYFESLDDVFTTVLGYNKTNSTKHVNFVKIKYGDGYFILNTQPFAFTNYQMLTSNHAVYVSEVLSYLPDNNLIWDERIKANTGEVGTPMRFILSKPSLRYAWYLGLFTLFLFMIFRAKRRQRIVPIIKKLPNTSIAFAKTIGNLYYQEGIPKDIISKKIVYFLEYLRNTYLLDTQNLNDDFKKRLHLKTGIAYEEINRLIDYIVNLNKASEPKENSLVTLTKLIDKFYTKTKL